MSHQSISKYQYPKIAEHAVDGGTQQPNPEDQSKRMSRMRGLPEMYTKEEGHDEGPEPWTVMCRPQDRGAPTELKGHKISGFA